MEKHTVTLNDIQPAAAAPIDHAATFTALLRCVRHSDLTDAEKDAFYDSAFLALDRWTDERKAEALAVVAVALAMRVRATGGGRE